MAIRLGSTVINCADIELMTSFWSQALNLVPSSAEAGDSDDQAAEVRRLTGLGARVVRHHEDPEDDYVVMTDPEGNEFCVCAVAAIKCGS